MIWHNGGYGQLEGSEEGRHNCKHGWLVFSEDGLA